MIIDSHCHLNTKELELDLDNILQEAYNNNVTEFIIVGFDKYTNLKTLELSNKFNNMYSTLGLHPSDVDLYNDNDLKEFKELVELNKTKIKAIGECGLDYHWNNNKIGQEKLLRMQIELSLKYNLPLIIHNREATSDLYNIFKDYKNLKGVMHCFTESYEYAKKFINLGFYLSFGGVLTFKKSEELRQTCKKIPLDKIIVETDTPYLTPEPFRSKPNRPKYIVYTLKKLSEIHELPYEDMIKITRNNTIKLFNLGEYKYEKI